MSSEKLEYAKKLAAITGRPISEFFNGTINDEIKKESDVDVNKNEFTEVQSDNKQTEKIEESYEVTEELLALQKLFAGSKIVKNKILYGRQMTKKEYNKYVKGLDLESYYKHPLMHKMFRAEGQTDPNFMSFTNRFNK